LPEKALSYARIAAVAGQKGDEAVTILDEEVLVQVLYKARISDTPEQAITDYEEFRRLGIDNPRVEHQTGIAFAKLNQHERARAIFIDVLERLPETNPEKEWAYRNLGLSCYRLQEMGQANAAFEHIPPSALSDPYLYAATRAAMSVWESSRTERDWGRAQALVLRSIEQFKPEKFPNRANSLAHDLARLNAATQ
jgi:tetratricopeptide (TPR) repeat protein